MSTLLNLKTERKLVVDPIREGQNWYGYCGNNPINRVDLWGLLAGDPFETPDAAAEDWAMTYNDDSIRENKELGSTIYKVEEEDGSYYYTYTIPNQGAKNSVSPSYPTNDEEVVATIHSHGDSTNSQADVFSEKDKRAARDDDKVDAYLANPFGKLLLFEISNNDPDYNGHEIKNDIPYDSNVPRGPIDENLYENNPGSEDGIDNEFNNVVESLWNSISHDISSWNE